jgi:PAS domain S-box-containing protein
MISRVRNPFAGYGIAGLCIGFAFAGRVALQPVLGDTAPFMLFILAAIVAAFFGGIGPGLLAAFSGQFIATYFFIAPRYNLLPDSLHQGVYWALYDVVVVSCVVVVEMLHRATARAEANHDRTRRQEEQLRTIVREMSDAQERIRNLAAVVESADDAIASMTVDGRVASWNTGAELLVGKSAREMIGASAAEIIREDLRGEFLATIARLMAGESASPVESVIVTADGREVDVSIRSSAVRDSTGAVAGISLIVRDICDAKQAEAEITRLNRDLKHHLDQTRQLMELLPVGVAMAADPDFTRVEINPMMASMLSVKPEDFLPIESVLANAMVLRDPSKVLRHLPLRTAAAEDRSIRGCEASLPTGNGRGIEVLGQSVPLHDESGQVRGAVGAFIDITELKRTNAALKETEGRFRAMADTAPLMIWMTDAARQSTWVNKTWRTFTGRGKELEPADGWAEPVHPDDRPMWKQTLEAAMRSRETFEIEYRLRQADGQMRWVLDRGVPRFGREGEFLGFIGSCMDVTAWKEAEVALEKKFDELREAQRTLRAQNQELAQNRHELEIERGRYRELFDSAPIGYVITTREGVIQQVNSAAAEMLNESADFLVGFPFARLLTKSDRTLFFANIGRLTRHEVAQITGWQALVEPHGRPPFPCSMTVNLLKDETGRVSGLRWILRDVTERQEFEQHILRLNSELEQRVKQRTAALEMANRELEAFSYSVSHDLRSPLRSINGFSKALLEEYLEKLDQQGVEFLNHIHNASIRMNRLIEDLLELSRVSRGDLRLQPVDVTSLATSIVNDLRALHPDRKVQVSIQSGLQVCADLGLLRIALENLIGNAWKFTGGRPSAKIEVGSFQKGDKTGIFVRDNGAGFAMENASRLFGVFQRLHSEHEFPGTGIGLATVKRISARHGGEVWAEAAVGAGATFYFTVPAGSGGEFVKGREQAQRPSLLESAHSASAPDSSPAQPPLRRRGPKEKQPTEKLSEPLLNPGQ